MNNSQTDNDDDLKYFSHKIDIKTFLFHFVVMHLIISMKGIREMLICYCSLRISKFLVKNKTKKRLINSHIIPSLYLSLFVFFQLIISRWRFELIRKDFVSSIKKKINKKESTKKIWKREFYKANMITRQFVLLLLLACSINAMYTMQGRDWSGLC